MIDNDTVRQVLTAAATRQALESAYSDLAAGEAVCRPRIDIRIPTREPDKFYQWGTMEGGSTGGYFAIRMKFDIIFEREYAGVRTEEKYCSRPGRYCGLVFLTDVNTGAPLALINDGLLQHLRVAADSAIGTACMARADTPTLGLLGSGAMAHAHVHALLEVRAIRRLRVYSPTPAHRERFAAQMAELHGIDCEALDNPRDVYRDADILAACTDSAEPVIRGEWLEPGMHVISIGGRPDAAATSPTPTLSVARRWAAAMTNRSRTPSAATSRVRSSMRSPPWCTKRRGAPAWAVNCPANGSCKTSVTEFTQARRRQ